MIIDLIDIMALDRWNLIITIIKGSNKKAATKRKDVMVVHIY